MTILHLPFRTKKTIMIRRMEPWEIVPLRTGRGQELAAMFFRRLFMVTMENEKNLEAKQRIESCWMTFEKDKSSCARRSVQGDHHQEPPPHFRWYYLRRQSLHSGPHLRYKTKFSMTIPNNFQEVHNAIGCVGSKQVYKCNKTRLPCFCSMGCCKQRDRWEEWDRFFKLYWQQRMEK